jgi:hypothetical protein
LAEHSGGEILAGETGEPPVHAQRFVESKAILSGISTGVGKLSALRVAAGLGGGGKAGVRVSDSRHFLPIIRPFVSLAKE